MSGTIREKISNIFRGDHHPTLSAHELLRYIGPGLLVTVGFIDPGNWGSNIAAGSEFGYTLLWVVTLSTIMLIILQHNAAHLGIATGLCLSEAATEFLPKKMSRFLVGSALCAAVSTALAEILGASIALQMLFHIPIRVGAVIVTAAVLVLIFRNTYKRIETIIIGFVSIIGLSFIYELTVIKVDWNVAVKSWVTPAFPDGSIVIIMSVLGAVVMPHNIFLHSEVIQSRQWNLENESVIRRQLKYEFLDTLFSMGVGWAINSAMIIVAAATFNAAGIRVEMLEEAKQILVPLLGNAAAVVFAFALLCSGVSSSVTAAIAGGSIFAGIYKEPFDIKDNHSRMGVVIIFALALLILLFVRDTFQGLVISQVVLSIQLPFTIFLLIALTSSRRVMGTHVNRKSTTFVLVLIGAVVTALNAILLVSVVR